VAAGAAVVPLAPLVELDDFELPQPATASAASAMGATIRMMRMAASSGRVGGSVRSTSDRARGIAQSRDACGSYHPLMRTPARLDQLSDEALLAALGLGEPDAAVAFVRRFQRRVYGVAVAVTSDPMLADDVAQQAFERAWRHAGSYDHRRGAVSTWLLSITRHLAIDAMRVRRAEPIDPWTVAELLPPSTATDPSMAAVASDQLRTLRVGLDALPPEQRRAVLLATVAGRTTTEIGAIEGIPVPTAKTRLRSGLRKLRDAVTEVEP
jgi:RNA polymerase sigma-70 factor (ECF subfamily)